MPLLLLHSSARSRQRKTNDFALGISAPKLRSRTFRLLAFPYSQVSRAHRSRLSASSSPLTIQPRVLHATSTFSAMLRAQVSSGGRLDYRWCTHGSTQKQAGLQRLPRSLSRSTLIPPQIVPHLRNLVVRLSTASEARRETSSGMRPCIPI